MTIQKLCYFIALLAFPVLHAQRDSVTVLREVIITDTQLRELTATQTSISISDSVVLRSPASLTSLLTFNTPIYFKENGYGMVSSPSFRGTTAQQTAVVWNGINVNSQLNGQTDFGATAARGFSDISVRAGGGSVIYGSSAIGGSIHLNNILNFGSGFSNFFLAEYGSFDTFGGLYTLSAGTEKFAATAAISRNSSDNDYPYPGYGVRNANGQFYNTSLNAAFGYRLSRNNFLRLYSYWYSGQRHFSGTLVAPSRNMYEDETARNMLEWLGLYGKVTYKLKLAVLNERYRYFPDFSLENYDFGHVNTYIARYDVKFRFTEKLFVNAIADYTANRGEGSDIAVTTREVLSGSLLLSQEITSRVGYEAGVRKENTSAYKSPLLFSAGVWFKPLSFYRLKINGSRNFRMPTFNDLYWQTGGNPNLKAENSLQAEIGNEFSAKGLTLTLSGYYMDIRDMIRWIPNGSLWSPENIDRVKSYGLEAFGSYDRRMGNNHIVLNATYAYTVSESDGTGLQLMYVPKHKATTSVAYGYKKATLYLRHLFTGEVYTTTDNSAKLKPYNILDAGAEYTFTFFKELRLGMRVQNVLDKPYQNVAQRPIPGRNYTLYLNFKF